MNMRDFISIVSEDAAGAIRAKNSFADSRFDTKSEVTAFMAGYGFHELGSGSWGSVFEHPHLDYVLKIFEPDSAYRMFVRVAQQNASNPYLPKFRGKVMSVGTRHYAVRMEKLVRMTDELFFGKLGLLNAICAEDEGDQAAVEHVEKTYPGFLQTVEMLRGRLASQDSFVEDFKLNNIMMRGQTPVIIDPFAEDQGSVW